MIRISIILIIMLIAGCDATEINKSINVMTYNIRFAAENGNPHDWSKRKEGISGIISNYDFIGLQEVVPEQFAYLISKSGNEYGFIYRTREADENEGEAVPLLYNKGRWEPVDSGNFWLSENPDVPGSRSWDAAYNRISSWGLFSEKNTSDTILVINLHLDNISQDARINSIYLIKNRFKDQLAKYPVILIGDFNVMEDNEVYSFITDDMNLSDSYRIINELPAEKDLTFNGWESETGISRIDFIFVSRDFEVQDSKVDRTKYMDEYPSDHFPVVSELKFNSAN
jgi:endonuclease/exonuclease/phosphatase family metal-dependent hydrolase